MKQVSLFLLVLLLFSSCSVGLSPFESEQKLLSDLDTAIINKDAKAVDVLSEEIHCVSARGFSQSANELNVAVNIAVASVGMEDEKQQFELLENKLAEIKGSRGITSIMTFNLFSTSCTLSFWGTTTTTTTTTMTNLLFAFSSTTTTTTTSTSLAGVVTTTTTTTTTTNSLLGSNSTSSSSSSSSAPGSATATATATGS